MSQVNSDVANDSGGQMLDIVCVHMMTLHAFPPRQVGGSLRVDPAKAN
jgi:hypothetical protein